jgi:hypothetical protein
MPPIHATTRGLGLAVDSRADAITIMSIATLVLADPAKIEGTK